MITSRENIASWRVLGRLCLQLQWWAHFCATVQVVLPIAYLSKAAMALPCSKHYSSYFTTDILHTRSSPLIFLQLIIYGAVPLLTFIASFYISEAKVVLVPLVSIAKFNWTITKLQIHDDPWLLTIPWKVCTSFYVIFCIRASCSLFWV